MSQLLSPANPGGGVRICQTFCATAPSAGCGPMLLNNGATVKGTDAAPNCSCEVVSPGAAFTRIRVTVRLPLIQADVGQPLRNLQRQYLNFTNTRLQKPSPKFGAVQPQRVCNIAAAGKRSRRCTVRHRAIAEPIADARIEHPTQITSHFAFAGA